MEFGLGLTKFVGPIVYLMSVTVFFLTLFYRIEVGIFFLVPCLALQNVLNYANDFPFGKDINDLLVMAMLIRWVLNRRQGADTGFIRSPVNLPIYLMIAWTFIGLWRGAAFLGIPMSFIDARFIAWKNFLMVPLLYFIVLNNIKETKHIQWVVVCMALAMLVLDRNFYNAAQGRDLNEYTDWRFASTGQALSGNALAVFQGQYTVVALTMLFYSRKAWHKVLFAVTVLFTLYCLMFSFSRSGYFAGTLALAVLGLIHERKILVALAILLIFWKSLLPPSVQYRIEMTKTDTGYDQTVVERLGMWELAKSMIAENPVSGAGYAITPFLNIHVEGFDYTWASFHSGYVETTVELGLVGIFIYLVFYALGIVMGWRLYRAADDRFLKGLGLGFAACVFGVLAGNFAGTYWNYMNVMAFYWVLLALVQRGLIISHHNESGPSPESAMSIEALNRCPTGERTAIQTSI